jgi:hypothetical protein
VVLFEGMKSHKPVALRGFVKHVSVNRILAALFSPIAVRSAG